MASEQQRYKSLYGGKRKLTTSEYLAQILVARKMESAGRKVVDDFWNDKSLLKEIKVNQVFLRKLIAVYGEVPVLRAYMRPDMQHVWSTTYPGLEQKIKEEKRKVDDAAKIVAPEVPTGTEHRTQEYGNKSILSKLRDLE